MNNNKNMQSAVSRNVIVIGTYLSKPVAEYLYKVHGKLARITLENPSANENFATPNGLKKMIVSTDKRVYVTRGAISEANVSVAKDAGLSFTELRSDAHDALVGRWFNFGAEQILEISSDQEIQALRDGKTLANAR